MPVISAFFAAHFNVGCADLNVGCADLNFGYALFTTRNLWLDAPLSL